MSAVASKERIVALSLEIEDKEKVIAILERKVEVGRAQLNDLDEACSQKYQRRLQEKAAEHKRIADELNEDTQSLMRQKADLIKTCKELMEIIQDTERDAQAELRGVYREGEEKIEAERRLFKQGHDERLQKFMTLKAQEYRENTNRGMEPEFKRLHSMYEHETEQLKLELQSEERRLRESMKRQFESAKEDERMATREEIKFMLKSIQERCTKDLEETAREFKQRSRSVRADNEKQLEKYQRQLKDKATRQRHDRHQELTELQESGQHNLLTLKKKHIDLVDKMLSEHDQKMRQMRRQAQDEKQKLDEQIAAQNVGSPSRNKSIYTGTSHHRAQTKSSRDVYDDEEEDDSELLISQRHRLKSHQQTSRPRPSSAGSRQQQQQRTQNQRTAAQPFDDLSLAIAELPPEHREQLETVRREAEEARDKQLQATIRSLETEAIRLEREWKLKVDREKNTIAQMESKELELITKKQRQCTEEIADLVVEREQYYTAVQEETRKEDKLQQDIAELRKEVAIYQEGIAAQRGRLRDKEEQHKLALREIQLQYGPVLRDLQEDIQRVEDELVLQDRDFQAEMRHIDEQQSVQLAELDSNVKEDVAVVDHEVLTLREELEAEKAKEQKLSLLIRKYGGGTNGSAVDRHGDAHSEEDSATNYRGDAEEDEDMEELLVARRRPSFSSSGSAVGRGIDGKLRSSTAGTVRRNGSTGRSGRSIAGTVGAGSGSSVSSRVVDRGDRDQASVASGRSHRTASTATYSLPTRASSANRQRPNSIHATSEVSSSYMRK